MHWLKNKSGKTDLKALALNFGLTAVAVAVALYISLKIIHVPSRKDVVFFFALAAFLPILKYPMIGVYYLFLIPPFIPMFRRFYYLFSQRPEQDLLHVISDIVVVILFAVCFDWIRKRIKVKTDDSRLMVWVWVFFFYQLLRVFVGNAGSMANGVHHFKFVGLYMGCFFFAINFITSGRQVVRLFRITSILGLFIALYGIKQAFIGFTEFEDIWLEIMRVKFVSLFIEGKARPFSTLLSPACFADYMMVSMMTSACLFSLKGTRYKWFYLACVPVMILGLLITSVRSNWMGMACGVFLWFIIGHRASLKAKILMLAGLVVFFMTLNTGMELFFGRQMSVAGLLQPAAPEEGEKNVTDLFVTDRVTALTNPFEEYSMVARFNIWNMVIRNVLRLPRGPMGYGLGYFDAHSYYFSTLFDTGFPGLFLLLYVLYRIVKLGYKTFREEEEHDKRVIARGILTFILAMSVVNATGNHLASHPGDIYFWFLSGLLLIIRRVGTGPDDGSYEMSQKLIDAT
jgi:hypothetical protein